jgi:hypothetical protein
MLSFMDVLPLVSSGGGWSSVIGSDLVVHVDELLGSVAQVTFSFPQPFAANEVVILSCRSSVTTMATVSPEVVSGGAYQSSPACFVRSV